MHFLDCDLYGILGEKAIQVCMQMYRFFQNVFMSVLIERIHLPMQETRVQSVGREDTLEEDVATPCSMLAWRIPANRGA